MAANLGTVPALARNLLFRFAMRMSSVLNGPVLCLSALVVCGCEGNGALGRAGGNSGGDTGAAGTGGATGGARTGGATPDGGTGGGTGGAAARGGGASGGAATGGAASGGAATGGAASGGSPGGRGGGHTGGSGGGAAGGGGTSGGGPALCAGATNSLVGCLTDASNAPVRLPLSVGVTVVGVEDVAAGGCGDSGPTRRFTLRGAGQQQWFASFRIPGMPTSLVTVGDVIELSVRSPSGSPTISLARSGRPLIFYHYDFAFIGPSPPDLSNYGIVVSDGGIECGAPALPCTTLGHRAHVTIGSAAGDVGRGQSAQIGGLSFVLEDYRTQTCVADPSSTIVYDPFQTMEMAGFATP